VLKVASICIGAGVGAWVVLGWIFWCERDNADFDTP
jgi:hypothetical protein